MIELNKSLKEYNTFRLNVLTKEFASFSSVDELRTIIKKSQSIRWYVLSGGSNTLFSSDFDGIILHPISKKIEVVKESDEYALVKVDSGVEWDDFVAYSIEKGWYGMENLSFIPGYVGASPVQNIGAYGVEAKDVIDSVEVYVMNNDNIVEMTNEECHFGYRDSIFKQDLKGEVVVLSVTFRLRKEFSPILKYGNLKTEMGEGDFTAKQLRDKIIDIRNAKLPDTKKIGNGGSFFKNPIVSEEKKDELLQTYPDMPFFEEKKGVKVPAGWLIEKAGWKGYRRGDAGVYEHQALVLVNYDSATPMEIVMLANDIIQDVKDKFGVLISPEINMI